MVAERVRRAVPIAVVLLIALVGIVLFALSHWRRGSAMFGIAALIGGILRWTVRDRDIGVLAVRGRAFDVTFLFGLAVLFALLVFWPE
jgi:hypothetical protein